MAYNTIDNKCTKIEISFTTLSICMRKYVVFIEEENSLQRKLGFDIRKAIGYLERFMDEGIISEEISSLEVWKPDDLDIGFFGDRELREKALSIKRRDERYFVIRAEVLDECNLNSSVMGFCNRFGFEGFNYEMKGGEKDV